MHFLRQIMLVVSLGLVMSLAAPVPAQAADVVPAPKPQLSPAAPMAGEVFYLEGQVQDPSLPRTIYLQRLDSAGSWKNERSVDSSDGTYRLPARVTGTTYFRVTASATADSGVMASPSVRVSPTAQYAKLLSVERICDTNNDCGSYAKAVGFVKPGRAGRNVYLQGLTSQGWKDFTGVKATTNASGAFTIPKFYIGNWPQWSTRKLRIAAGRYAGSTYAVSGAVSFMPGPKNLGDNVLRVDVDGGSYPTKKGVEYKGFATLIQEGSTTPKITRARLDNFGVRGSTTAGYPKKPYNMRFEAPPSVDVFGMDADRRWTLLAMYADQSYVRDKTALDLGRKLATKGGMSWNPDSRYVELFVNSLYMGAYLLTEKVDIDSDKVDVDKDSGMIMEVDMDTVSDPRKGFRTARGGLVFAFKEPDSLGGSEGITSGKLSAVKNRLAAVESLLYTSNRSYYWKLIDRYSAADFHLAVEFFKDIDSDFWRSKYFSWDTSYQTSISRLRDQKLHFGPLWDFDKSTGNVDPTNPGTAFTRSYRGWQANGTGVGKDNRVTFHTHWFVQLWKTPLFRSDLARRWNTDKLRNDFWYAAAKDVDQNKAEIGWGAANDRRRWAGSAKLYRPKGSSYDDEVKYVKYWLLNRFSWMDSQL